MLQYDSSQGHLFISSAISLDGEQVAWTGGSTMDEKARIHTANLCTGARRELLMHSYHVDGLASSQNGERLVAVGWTWHAAIWDVVTGVCLREFRHGNEQVAPMWNLNTSFINFDFTRATNSSASGKWEGHLARYYISRNGIWVMRHGKRLLWIPPEYRPKDAAASGSNIAVARASGRPYVIGFSDDDL